ncbi:MAG: hypothetical protein ACNI25_07795 [Halarcobacter sp.]
MKYKNRTAFERDCNSELAELFLQVRDFVKICIGNGVKEKHNEHTSSFFTKEGGFCSIKVKDDYIYFSWFKGAVLNDKYNKLEGKGKVARKQIVYNLDKQTRAAIRYYIEETFVKLIEYNELKNIKSSFKGQNNLDF